MSQSHKIESSAILTAIAIILLFSTAIIVTLIAPSYVDPTWTSASSPYQEQMYLMEDPNTYITTLSPDEFEISYIYHIKESKNLLAFVESDEIKIKAPKELERYITRPDDKTLKLTSKILLLKELSEEKTNQIKTYQLYDPKKQEAFVTTKGDGNFQDWTDSQFEVDFQNPSQYGTIYKKNPQEFVYQKNESSTRFSQLEELLNSGLKIKSRKQLIEKGEQIYASEGCWYCHTDQTRTLIQDVVLNGSDSYPAPPSSPNEYVFQNTSFLGTRRIGPDLSRVGIIRPSRQWHRAHFWDPKVAVRGSIMPKFRHFFKHKTAETNEDNAMVNQNFEAIYQYLMTKGTRITAPSSGWWIGKDPIKTKKIIEGERLLKQ